MTKLKNFLDDLFMWTFSSAMFILGLSFSLGLLGFFLWLLWKILKGGYHLLDKLIDKI